MAEPAHEVWFYHLERSDLRDVLPELLEKTLARGWRALVVSDDPDQLAALDEHLWTYRDESFLPHAISGGPMDGAQPILLSSAIDNRNGAQALFVVGGEPGELPDVERAVVIFDGRSDEALASARRLWSRMKGEGRPVVYWRQSDRGWTRQG